VSHDSLSGEGQQKTATLTRELSEFLLEFSIGVHRYSMYPPGHPSLRPASENLLGRLSEVLASRSELSIGVARDQLILEGVATESRHPVLRDLARRLHKHELGAVSFGKGATADEVEGLLSTLAQDPDRGGSPLGRLESGKIPNWTHIRLYPVGYDQLELTVDEGPAEITYDRATDLWLRLARAAVGGGEAKDGEGIPEASTVARSIRTRQRDAAYDQVIVGYLLQLAEELKGGKGAVETESVRKRVSSLVRDLDEETLKQLVRTGGSAAQRNRFVLDASQSLAVDSVVKLLRAASDTSHQTISHSLTRLLSKLSSQAEAGSDLIRGQAESAFRENVEDLITGWELRDPNPEDYTLILDSIARAAPIFQGAPEMEGSGLAGARRILQMSFELDTWGPVVEKAAAELMAAGEVGWLFGMVDAAPPESHAARALQAYMTRPERLSRLLLGEDVQEDALRTLASRIGKPAIPALLAALVDSESRAIRRKVFDALVGFGEDVGPSVVERLEDPRWFVLRNMLSLIKLLPEKPEGFSPGRFLEHEDVRVRREAFALAVREPTLRERTLAMGLADEDERTLRMALLETQESLPETLVPVLVSRVIRGRHDSETRAMALRALRHSRSNLALEVLLEVCNGGKSILGRQRLPPASPEVLTALRVLGEIWPQDHRAADYLKAARRSKDPQIRWALSGELRGG
jgi:hypothetical protein